MYHSKILLLSIIVFIILPGYPGYGDALLYKNGKEEKGFVVKELSDRVVFSSIKGEKEVPLADLKGIVYDEKEKMLMQNGRVFFKQGDYVSAYHAFEDVLKKDPDNDKARERMRYLRTYLENYTYKTIINNTDISREYFEGKVPEEPAKDVLNELGISIDSDGKYIYIKGFEDNKKSLYGLEPDDRIISVWGENVVYANLSEAARLLLSSHEIDIEIERTVAVKPRKLNRFMRIFFKDYYPIIGARLAMTRKGIMVKQTASGGPFDEAGILKGDVIEYFNGRDLKYVPFRNLSGIIKALKERSVNVTVLRKIKFWRKNNNVK